MSSKAQDIMIAALSSLIGFMLYWMFTTNSRVDQLVSDSATRSKFWRIHGATKDKLNEVIDVLEDFENVEITRFAWPPLN